MLRKITILFFLPLSLLLSCAAGKGGRTSSVPSELDHLRALEQLWSDLDRATQTRNTAVFSSLLTQDSFDWLEGLTEEIERMPEPLVRARPFHEVFMILGTRFLYRNQELGSYHYDEVVAALMKERPLRSLFSRNDLGDFWFENDEGWRGLERAGSVPLFFFRLENGRWRLDLQKTLPVVMRGLEAVTAKKKLDNADAVIYILNMHLKYKADEELLQP